MKHPEINDHWIKEGRALREMVVKQASTEGMTDEQVDEHILGFAAWAVSRLKEADELLEATDRVLRDLLDEINHEL